MEDLKEYYNGFGYEETFDEMSDEYKTQLAATLGFACFKLSKYLDEVKNSLRNNLRNSLCRN